MIVKVKLLATLQRYKPEVIAGEPFEVELPEPATISDLVAQLGIRDNEVKVVYVNGRARATVYRLNGGDEVGIFPPVGGG